MWPVNCTSFVYSNSISLATGIIVNLLTAVSPSLLFSFYIATRAVFLFENLWPMKLGLKLVLRILLFQPHPKMVP